MNATDQTETLAALMGRAPEGTAWAVVRHQKNGHECVPLYFTADNAAGAIARYLSAQTEVECVRVILRRAQGTRETVAEWKA